LDILVNEVFLAVKKVHLLYVKPKMELVDNPDKGFWKPAKIYAMKYSLVLEYTNDKDQEQTFTWTRDKREDVSKIFWSIIDCLRLYNPDMIDKMIEDAIAKEGGK